MVDRCRGYLRIPLLDDVEHEVEEGAEDLAAFVAAHLLRFSSVDVEEGGRVVVEVKKGGRICVSRYSTTSNMRRKRAQKMLKDSTPFSLVKMWS